MRPRLTLAALSAFLLAAAGAIAGGGFAGPALAADVAGRTPVPVIEPAAKGERCVGEPAFMRRNHMDLLKHQRDDTVFGGIRGAKNSLKECIACHASVKTGSVAKAETNFCVSCHSYTAVKIDCFECHTAKPAAKPAALPARALTPTLCHPGASRDPPLPHSTALDPGPVSSTGWHFRRDDSCSPASGRG